MDPHRDLKDVMKSFYDRNVRYHELIGGMEEGGYTYDDLIVGLLGRAAIPGRRLRVVDVAAGTGYNLMVAKAAGAASFGIDLSIHACRIARGKDRELAVCRGDAETLPFRDAAFDLALCIQLIEHTPFPEKVIAEITRVLRPGRVSCSSLRRTCSGRASFRGSCGSSRASFPGRSSGSGRCPQISCRGGTWRRTPWRSPTSTPATGSPSSRRSTSSGRTASTFVHLDTLRHPKKYRPGRYASAQALQRIPVLRYTGVNFKIIARKR